MHVKLELILSLEDMVTQDCVLSWPAKPYFTSLGCVSSLPFLSCVSERPLFLKAINNLRQVV